MTVLYERNALHPNHANSTPKGAGICLIPTLTPTVGVFAYGGYNDAGAGLYFVTINTFRRVHLFGSITDGEMHLNAYGHVVHHEWEHTARLRQDVVIDSFVVMPNHTHAIVVIQEKPNTPDNNENGRNAMHP